MLPIVGCVFRKTYYDPIRRKNCSKMITAKDFVINYWATSLDDAPRFTQIIRFYPYEVEERVRSGLWAEVNLNIQQSDRDESETAPVDFLEQHCRLDLDEDGYPEPYVVTLLRENGKVVRIVPCFDADGVTMGSGEDGAPIVVRIEQKRYFTKYGFIPSPDGSFYDIGFGALLDDIGTAINTTVNQMLDAGALQNAQGGFIGSGVNMRSGDLKFRLGEWKRVDVSGGTLAQNIVPLNLPGPSAVLFELLQLLIAQAKDITSVQDILTGAGVSGTTPATTVLAQIEQATKMMTAIFKRIHRSFGEELRILFGLNRDFLDERAYYALTDAPAMIGRADYQDRDIDVIPVSDPTQVNDAMAAVRAQALAEFRGDPLVNQEALRRRILTAQGQADIDELLKVPAPPPDPKVLIEGAKLALSKIKTATDADKARSDSIRTLMESAEKAMTLGLLPDAALFAGAAQQLAQESIQPEAMNEQADGAGGMGGMEEPPADAGIPPLPQGPALGPDGGMVGGGEFGAGGADPGLHPEAAAGPLGG
jgi:chaperonin GroES